MENVNENVNSKKRKSMEVISIESQTFEAMMSRFESFSLKVANLCENQKDKSLHRWLDNQDVCRILNISKRTLQTYRDNGILAYCQINHKMFYKPQDVEDVINRLKLNEDEQ